MIVHMYRCTIVAMLFLCALGLWRSYQNDDWIALSLGVIITVGCAVGLFYPPRGVP